MMNNLKKILVPLLFLQVAASAQILDKYPKGQDFYVGGRNGFLHDAHDYVTEKKLEKCPPGQIYYARFLVMPDKSVKFVKDFDEETIKKNQCAYDLSLKILENIKDFQPAAVNGKPLAAEAEMVIYPDDLFENFFVRGNFYENYKPAEYKKGNERFRQDLRENMRTLFSNYHVNADFVLDFYVDEKGNIVNEAVHPQIEDRGFAVDFSRTLHWMNGKFTPATYKGVPVKQRFTVPMSFNTKFHAR